MLPSLYSEQMDIFRAVVNADDSNHEECIFVHGSGGIGKTYLRKVIVAALRLKRKIILSVASYEIVAYYYYLVKPLMSSLLTLLRQHIAHSQSILS